MRSEDEIDTALRSVTEKAAGGEFDQALKQGLPLLQQHPEDPRVSGVLAGVLWRAGEVEEAAKLFSRTTIRSPRSALASLGLFHCLWGLGRLDEARTEVARFLALGSSEEHELLLEEMGWRFDGDSGLVVDK